MDVIGSRYRLIAPDHPGFGRTEVPDGFTHRFDRLADVTEGFVQRLGLDRFVMYVFDYGAPIGFRTCCSTTAPTSTATAADRPGCAGTRRPP
ncbi:alpha/beta fold hydrolase [Streptomyces sp. AC602_WCS936]|uniref:alpha/beta fold hydrolase n=1 Tax=Streptomyces sp. AC602_WCS936 TaxID=2823685 RepID=UPI0027E40A9D|nr:alpha/beta fold hydrolase [Streptomyces sp. AC602_WCS936]